MASITAPLIEKRSPTMVERATSTGRTARLHLLDKLLDLNAPALVMVAMVVLILLIGTNPNNRILRWLEDESLFRFLFSFIPSLDWQMIFILTIALMWKEQRWNVQVLCSLPLTIFLIGVLAYTVWGSTTAMPITIGLAALLLGAIPMFWLFTIRGIRLEARVKALTEENARLQKARDERE